MHLIIDVHTNIETQKKKNTHTHIACSQVHLHSSLHVVCSPSPAPARRGYHTAPSQFAGRPFHALYMLFARLPQTASRRGYHMAPSQFAGRPFQALYMLFARLPPPASRRGYHTAPSQFVGRPFPRSLHVVCCPLPLQAVATTQRPLSLRVAPFHALYMLFAWLPPSLYAVVATTLRPLSL